MLPSISYLFLRWWGSKLEGGHGRISSPSGFATVRDQSTGLVFLETISLLDVHVHV